ncbi:unnamed protein product, partial [Enterobius vermicularis]|uniref:Protein quiver n=1 Tax=Enterobius vermicularis TaxID=51028 RepID=A0A0N4VHK5_ENTVE
KKKQKEKRNQGIGKDKRFASKGSTATVVAAATTVSDEEGEEKTKKEKKKLEKLTTEMSWWPILLIFNLCLNGLTFAVISQPNCTAKNKFACYVCLGESLTDCRSEETVCCSGACYKLVDIEHQVILKGCTPDKEEDGSMKIRSYDVRVRNDEPVKGQTFFCNEGEYCNGVRLPNLHNAIWIICSILLLIHPRI